MIEDVDNGVNNRYENDYHEISQTNTRGHLHTERCILFLSMHFKTNELTEITT